MAHVEVYKGERRNGVCSVWRERRDGWYVIPTGLELVNHSPTGFEWGYHGSGPAQLAAALLFDALGAADLARRLHQDFKFEVVARWHEATWQIRVEEVIQWAFAKLLSQVADADLEAEVVTDDDGRQ